MHNCRCTTLQVGNLPVVPMGLRGAIKLYADFLQSDIIVASPIALATLLAEAPDQARSVDV